MIDDPSYNILVELDCNFICDTLYHCEYDDANITVMCWKHPITNQYKIIINHDEYTSYFYCLDEKLTLHRENYPASIVVFDYKTTYEEYYEYGVPHCINGPQKITYYEGKIVEQYYKINNQLHRTNGPAYVSYYQQTQIPRYEKYLINDKFHRLDGPAFIKYDWCGNKEREIWYENNIVNRLDGPARIKYNHITHEVQSKEWVINGKKLDIKRLPRFENNKLCGRIKLTKNSIIKAMLFDREYGSFLKEMYERSSK